MLTYTKAAYPPKDMGEIRELVVKEKKSAGWERVEKG